MRNEADYKKQISDIQEIIAETRSGYTGGGVIALVWGLLSALAFAVSIWGSLNNTWAIWIIHSLLGWTFTLLWFSRENRTEGRVSLRGRYTLRLWAVITLAIWTSLGLLPSLGIDLSLGISALLPLLLGLGVFTTGLLSESGFSQCIGVALLLSGPAITMFAPPSRGPAYALAAIILISLVWSVGSWLIKGKR
ncbi:MAG: hypothetical protein ABFD49_09350 [Armatimonadota bacterium]|nr:hypothetical protein [bacterium]